MVLQLQEELSAAEARRHHHHHRHHHNAAYVGISASSGALSSGSGNLGVSHQTASPAHLTLAAAPAPHATVMLTDHHHVLHPVVNHPSIPAEFTVRFSQSR